MVTITKKDLVALGYGTSFATDIIRLAKKRMVERGFTFYESRKLDRVPTETVEEILGITIGDSHADSAPFEGDVNHGKRNDNQESN